jgi:hypothetical protein
MDANDIYDELQGLTDSERAVYEKQLVPFLAKFAERALSAGTQAESVPDWKSTDESRTKVWRLLLPSHRVQLLVRPDGSFGLFSYGVQVISPANRLAFHGLLAESGLAEVQADIEKALLGSA